MMPAHVIECDIAIVGGGITGSACAYYLARGGVRVALLEQYDLNTQASGRNAGSLHGQYQLTPYRTMGREWATQYVPAMRFLVDSITMWRNLAEELGTDLEVTGNGGLLVADTDELAAVVEEKVRFEAAQGFTAELVTGKDLRQLAPYLAPTIVAAEYCATEGTVNPLLAAPAFARAARRHGAEVLTGTTVTAVNPASGSFSLETTGPTITCAQVVLAAGAGLADLAAPLGDALPIVDEPVQVQVTEPVAPTVPHLVYYAGGKLTFKQSHSGSLIIGGGWLASVDAASGYPHVRMDSMRQNLDVAARVAPWIAPLAIVRSWAGVGSVTPDLAPIIGESSTPGVFFGMFPHMGMTGGPLMGLTLAQLVRGAPTTVDITSFAPGRFTPVTT
jgi:glycine/D-amino acid oxidase-like deaminating enzyme